uniref:Uncharacterized protein n=2 Tax=Parascaris univalens TaxID=6257 RepID=A0A915CBA9_PARUN
MYLHEEMFDSHTDDFVYDHHRRRNFSDDVPAKRLERNMKRYPYGVQQRRTQSTPFVGYPTSTMLRLIAYTRCIKCSAIIAITT